MPAGSGPPAIQSSNWTVCTTGTPPESCVMQPMLPAAIRSGRVRAIVSSLRARRRPAISGCIRL